MICDKCIKRAWCSIKCQLWHLENGGRDEYGIAVGVGLSDDRCGRAGSAGDHRGGGKAEPLTFPRQRFEERVQF